jgi:hypothetical protein
VTELTCRIGPREEELGNAPGILALFRLISGDMWCSNDVIASSARSLVAGVAGKTAILIAFLRSVASWLCGESWGGPWSMENWPGCGARLLRLCISVLRLNRSWLDVLSGLMLRESSEAATPFGISVPFLPESRRKS